MSWPGACHASQLGSARCCRPDILKGQGVRSYQQEELVVCSSTHPDKGTLLDTCSSTLCNSCVRRVCILVCSLTDGFPLVVIVVTVMA